MSEHEAERQLKALLARPDVATDESNKKLRNYGYATSCRVNDIEILHGTCRITGRLGNGIVRFRGAVTEIPVFLCMDYLTARDSVIVERVLLGVIPEHFTSNGYV